MSELDDKTDNAEEKYNKFYTSVHNVISDYAYKFTIITMSSEYTVLIRLLKTAGKTRTGATEMSRC